MDVGQKMDWLQDLAEVGMEVNQKWVVDDDLGFNL